MPKTTHGMHDSLTYRSWNHMKARTTYANANTTYPKYKNVSVDPRWMNFENFFEDMGERPSKQHSLDRLNNDGPYCKSNCRWATREEQAKNRGSFNRQLFYCGKLNGYQSKIYLLCELAQLAGVHQKLLGTRLRQGMNLDKALEPWNHLSKRKHLKDLN